MKNYSVSRALMMVRGIALCLCFCFPAVPGSSTAEPAPPPPSRYTVAVIPFYSPEKIWLLYTPFIQKVIFASGYDPDLVRQKALLAQNVPVVYKPVPMAELLKKIRVVLDGSA